MNRHFTEEDAPMTNTKSRSTPSATGVLKLKIAVRLYHTPIRKALKIEHQMLVAMYRNPITHTLLGNIKCYSCSENDLMVSWNTEHVTTV
jgi:hypothetical protein